MTSSDLHGTYTVFYGPVINPVSLTCHCILPHCVLVINPSGKIARMFDCVEKPKLQETIDSIVCTNVKIVILKDGEFLMPGFIDTHTHAPQFPIMGTGNQYQLLEWLNKLVFPAERDFRDPDYAKVVCESVVRRVLDFGTTTCCYYSSLHLEATKNLADVAHAYGQRAFIGKCNMNRKDKSPCDYIEESTEASIRDTLLLIEYIRGLDHPSDQEPLVQPILTPRFAISCTSDLLSRLGSLATLDPTLRIQTHIGENEAEVVETLKLYPDAKSYAHVYDTFGLLRYNTILAHAVHLTQDEVELIKDTKAGISHCPTSNFNLNSGIAPVGYYLDSGIKVGLGTDVSGGYSPSILNAIQNASIAAKALSFRKECPRPDQSFTNRPLSISALLYLATAGGAAVCNIENQVGSFALDKSFDALLVNVGKDSLNPGLWGLPTPPRDDEVDLKEKIDGWLERFLHCGDDRNIEKVYVQGCFVGGRTFKA